MVERIIIGILIFISFYLVFISFYLATIVDKLNAILREMRGKEK